MNELDVFEQTYGKPLTVGTLVTVDGCNSYAADWPGVHIVTGINWDNRRQCFDVTIAENWNDGGSDGWKPSDLCLSHKPSEKQP